MRSFSLFSTLAPPGRPCHSRLFSYRWPADRAALVQWNSASAGQPAAEFPRLAEPLHLTEPITLRAVKSEPDEEEPGFSWRVLSCSSIIHSLPQQGESQPHIIVLWSKTFELRRGLLGFFPLEGPRAPHSGRIT